jgi:hypothetical protein
MCCNYSHLLARNIHLAGFLKYQKSLAFRRNQSRGSNSKGETEREREEEVLMSSPVSG